MRIIKERRPSVNGTQQDSKNIVRTSPIFRIIELATQTLRVKYYLIFKRST